MEAEQGVKGFLEKVLNIHPGEFKRVGIMFIYSLFAMGGAFVVGRTVSNALFLANLEEQYIPYRYIGMAIGITLAAMLYSRLATFVSKVKLNLSMHACLTLIVIAFRLLLFAHPGNMIIIAGLYFFFEIMGALVTIQFWNFATEVFHAREAKRLFGIIAAGGIISNVIAGGFVRTAAKTIGAEDLIWAVAFALIVCMVCVYLLRNQIEEKKQKKISTRRINQAKPSSLLGDISRLRKSPQLVSIAAIVAITAIVTNVADYQLSVVLKINYSVADISSFYGSYYLISGIVATVIQLFFTGKLLQKYGILLALLLLPGAMFLGFVSTILFTALYTIAPTRGADTVLRYTVNESTMKLLYLPVDSEFRPRANSIIDGMLKPIATGFAGVLFIFMRSFNLSLIYYSFLAVGLLAVWMFLAARARRQYMLALANSLLSRKLDLAGASVNIDEATTRFLIKSLNHKNASYILHALEIIKTARTVNWDPHVGHLLERPEPEIRASALEFLAQLEETVHFSKVLKLLDDDNQTVKAAAIKAVCALNPSYAMMAVTQYLQHENPEIKSVAIIGMIKDGGLDGILMAAGELKGMLEHHDWRMRMYGAKVLGELNVQTFYHPLIKLINDAHIQVQKEAIAAAGQLKSKHLMTLLIYKLADKQLQAVATQALVKFGVDSCDALIKVLNNSKEKVAIRRAMPKILQTIGGEDAIKAMLAATEYEDIKIRHNALMGLATLSADGKILDSDKPKLETVLLEEAKAFCLNLAVESDLELYDARGLIHDALMNRRIFILDRIFYIMQILYPEGDLAPIRRGLKSSKKQMRANAVEYIDNLLEPHLKKFILPLLEDLPLEKRSKVARELFDIKKTTADDRLIEMAKDGDYWLQTVAMFEIGENKLDEMLNIVESRFEIENETVQETALLTLTKLLSGDRLTDSIKKIIQKDTLLVKEFAEHILKETTA